MQSLKKLLIVPGSCLLPFHREWILYRLLGLVLAFLLVHPLLLLVDVVWPLPLRPRSNHFGLVPLTLLHQLLFEAGEVMNVPSSTSLLWMVSYRLQGFGSQSIRRTLWDLLFHHRCSWDAWRKTILASASHFYCWICSPALSNDNACSFQTFEPQIW